ncbi:MAG: hypothetical protein HWN80_02110 [Candidatus Lokiarchaeota archaeon]|nr:hypothetical protein [Candidatus Lokiarchaeota archaeon]
MTEVDNISQESLELQKVIPVLGIGLVSMSQNRYNIVFIKGISRSLMKDLIHLYRSEILEKEEGKMIDLLGIFTVYIHFYTLGNEKISLFYINEKDKLLNYGDLCSLSRLLVKIYCSNVSHSKISQICNKAIPSVKGLSALFVISTTGHTLFTKIRNDKTQLLENYIQIGGFLSAILMFSNEVIGKNSGESLQAINFENQQFHIIVEEGIIFAYLVEQSKNSKTVERYMELLKEEFIELYYDCLKDFNGDLNQFHTFEPVVEKYFSI